MRISFLRQKSLLVSGLICLLLLLTLAHSAIAAPLELTEVEQRWLDEHPDITLAYDGFFPPYSFKNDQGELEGFAVDLVGLISDKTGIRFNIASENEWSALYRAAQDKQLDVVATMVAQSDRLQWFTFTRPYIHKSLVVITREEDNRISRKQDVSGKTIALVKGYQYEQKIVKEFPTIRPFYVDTMQDALNAVSLGDADGAITFLGASHFVRNKYLLTNLKYAAVYDRHSANESFAVRRDWPELASILNKALDSVSEAQLQQLRNKWLPVDYMENLVEIKLTESEQQWIKQYKTIRLGIDPEFAPFEYLDEDRYQGMASDYVKLLNQRLNLNMQIVRGGLSWKEVISNAEKGEIDVLPAVGITEQRQQYLSFTQPYLNFHRVIVTREDAPFIAGLQDLHTLQVAVQADSSHYGYITEQSDINPVVYSTLQESLMAVSGGEVDSFIGNVASVTYWIRKLNLTNLKIAAPVSTDVQSLHFAVRKDWPELTSILQKGLDSISPRQRKIISEKWLSVEYSPTVDYSLLWNLLIACTMLVGTVLLWNIMLNRKVRMRTAQLEYSASYDQLTDLPNRFLIQDRLAQLIDDARRQQRKVALLSVDINDFKKINEAFGHKAGDMILREFSRRLKVALGEKGITVGRLGGNQFLVMQTLFDIEDSVVLAERIIACTHQKFDTPDQPVSLQVSLGISLYPNDGDTAELLLKYADTATHYAKKQSHERYAFYTDSLIRNVSRKLELERYMHEALNNNEFEVYFQPKVESKQRKIVSFEALLRWSNKDIGMVSPAEFIPIAEKNGLIEEIGLFVMKESLAALKYWQKRYQTEFSIAVNLSPVQFRSEDLIPTIESLILNYGLHSKNIEFEITEGLLLSDYPMIEEQLRRLESLGVTLAMDDFGTGYSSLSYLRKYKFDTLKIDREFISDLPSVEADRKLVAATIAMAHELGMTVVAEGVETEEQCKILVENNCDVLQGWLFCKAMTLSDTTVMLDSQYVTADEIEI